MNAECRRWVCLAWAGTLCLLAIGSPGASAAERDTYQSARDAAAQAKKQSGSWWQRLWPFAKKQEPPSSGKKAASKTASPAPAQTRPISAPLGLEGARLIAEEQAKFLRRQQVCDRIREAALARGDSELEKQAQLLEQRAWFLYEQRTAQARVPSLLPLDDSLAASRLDKGKPTAASAAASAPIRSVIARRPQASHEGDD
jgi:hypothetical protein